MMKTILLSLAMLALVVPAHGIFGKSDTKTSKSEDAVSELPPYNGVRHALGVVAFENQAGWRSKWDLGENLALMLESSLGETDRFVMVDRQELGSVMGEQDLQASGRASGGSRVAQTGMIRSARYLASGAVTRVDEGTSGGSGGIGFGGIRVGAGGSKSEIELVVRIVDSTTGEIVASERILGEAGGRSLSLGLYRSGVGLNLGGFEKTPIGEAAQDAIAQAVYFIAMEMEDYEISANVVMVRGDQVIINRGEEFGVSVGDEFLIQEVGEVLTDPETGAVLDVFEGEVTGRIKVTRVTDKVSYCELVDGDTPARGDAVIFQN